jgi:hypothetical protein
MFSLVNLTVSIYKDSCMEVVENRLGYLKVLSSEMHPAESRLSR